MLKNSLLSLAVCLLAAATGVAQAFDMNGYLREPKTGTVALSFTSESYDQFWMGETKIDTPPELGEIETESWSVWFAYGFTERFTLLGSVPYVDTSGDGLAGLEESDLQDLSLLGAYRFAQLGADDRHSFIGALGFRTNLTDYVSESPVAIGDATTDVLARVVYQYTLPRFYVSQQVGYDLRSDDAPDGYPLYTEVGGHLGARVTVSGFYALLFADDAIDIGEPGFDATFFPKDQEESERAGAKVYVRITDHFGASAAYFDTLDGRNTGDAAGGSLGAIFDF